MSIVCHLNVNCHKMSLTWSDIFQTFREQKFTFDKTLIAVILPTHFSILLPLCTLINIYKVKILIKSLCCFYARFQFYMMPNIGVDIYFQKISQCLIEYISSASQLNATIKLSNESLDISLLFKNILHFVGLNLAELESIELCHIVHLECPKNVICDIMKVTKMWHLWNNNVT